MAVTSRNKRLAPAERRAQLIQLGVDELRRNGGSLATVDRIAEAAGISRGLLFHYFPTKQAFHVALVEETARMMLEATDPPRTLDPVERLRAGLAGYIDFVRQNEALYVSLLRGSAGSDDAMQAIFNATRGAFVDRLIEGLGGTDPTPLIRTALRGWVGFVEESTLDWVLHHDVDRAQLIELQERALIQMMGFLPS